MIEMETWRIIVELVKEDRLSSINVASEARRKAIIWADEKLKELSEGGNPALMKGKN